MGKTFTYTKITGHYYCNYKDDWEEDGVEFEYEVENKDLLPEVVDLVFEEYFKADKVVYENEGLTKLVKERLSEIIDNNYLVETFADQYEEDLKDIFEQEAMRFYDD